MTTPVIMLVPLIFIVSLLSQSLIPVSASEYANAESENTENTSNLPVQTPTPTPTCKLTLKLDASLAFNMFNEHILRHISEFSIGGSLFEVNREFHSIKKVQVYASQTRQEKIASAFGIPAFSALPNHFDLIALEDYWFPSAPTADLKRAMLQIHHTPKDTTILEIKIAKLQVLATLAETTLKHSPLLGIVEDVLSDELVALAMTAEDDQSSLFSVFYNGLRKFLGQNPLLLAMKLLAKRGRFDELAALMIQMTNSLNYPIPSDFWSLNQDCSDGLADFINTNVDVISILHTRKTDLIPLMLSRESFSLANFHLLFGGHGYPIAAITSAIPNDLWLKDTSTILRFKNLVESIPSEPYYYLELMKLEWKRLSLRFMVDDIDVESEEFPLILMNLRELLDGFIQNGMAEVQDLIKNTLFREVAQDLIKNPPFIKFCCIFFPSQTAQIVHNQSTFYALMCRTGHSNVREFVKQSQPDSFQIDEFISVEDLQIIMDECVWLKDFAIERAFGFAVMKMKKIDSFDEGWMERALEVYPRALCIWRQLLKNRASLQFISFEGGKIGLNIEELKAAFRERAKYNQLCAVKSCLEGALLIERLDLLLFKVGTTPASFCNFRKFLGLTVKEEIDIFTGSDLIINNLLFQLDSWALSTVDEPGYDLALAPKRPVNMGRWLISELRHQFLFTSRISGGVRGKFREDDFVPYCGSKKLVQFIDSVIFKNEKNRQERMLR